MAILPKGPSWLPILLVLSAATQQPAGTQAPVRYRFESRNTSTIDMTAYDEGTQQKRSTTSAVLSVTIEDTVGGQIAKVVIDSIRRDDGGAMTEASDHLAPEVTASGRGAFFHMFLVDGRIRDYSESMPNNLDVTAVSGAIDLLFPGVTTSTKVKATWADTIATDTSADSKASSSEITHWTMVAKDTVSATVISNKTSVIGTKKSETDPDLGLMVTTGTGTKRVVFDANRQVKSGSLSMTSTAKALDAKIKGVTTATLTRIP